LIVAAIGVFEGELAQGCENQEADKHPACPNHETAPATEFFHKVETWERRNNVDGA